MRVTRDLTEDGVRGASRGKSWEEDVQVGETAWEDQRQDGALRWLVLRAREAVRECHRHRWSVVVRLL